MVKIYYYMVFSPEKSFFFFLTIISYNYLGGKKVRRQFKPQQTKAFKFLRGKLHSSMKEIGRDFKENLLSDDHP